MNTHFEGIYEPRDRQHERVPETREFQLPQALDTSKSFVQHALAKCAVYDPRMIELIHVQLAALGIKHLNTYHRTLESWKRFEAHFEKVVKQYVVPESKLPREPDSTDSLNPSNPLHMVTDVTIMAVRGVMHLGRLTDRYMSGNPLEEQHLDPKIDIEQIYEEFMRSEHDDKVWSIQLP